MGAAGTWVSTGSRSSPTSVLAIASPLCGPGDFGLDEH